MIHESYIIKISALMTDKLAYEQLRPMHLISSSQHPWC